MSELAIPIPSSIFPPRDAYKFWPQSNYIFHGSGKKLVRHIFEFQQLSEFENKKLVRLEKEIKQGRIENFPIPPSWSRNHLLRYCYGTNWKTRNSIKALLTYLKWVSEKIPRGYKFLYPRIHELLNNGTFYISGRDCMYRPLIVLDFGKIDFKTNAIDLYSDMLCFLLEYVIEYMLIPGQVENWVVLIDLGRKGLGSLSINSLKQVLSILQINFRCRMGMTYIVNPPKSMFMLWSCIKPFLDEILIEKIKISNGPTSSEMLSTFNPCQIEEKYGGRSKNIEKFWPPLISHSNFDPPGKPIQLSDRDTYRQFNQIDSKKIEENSPSIKQKHKSKVNSLEVSVEYSDICLDELENEKFSRSDAEDSEPLVEIEPSVFFDCKSQHKSFEQSFRNEARLGSSVKKPLQEKSFHNDENLSPYKCVAIDKEFETPKRKGPRLIGIIFEKDDRWKNCSSFGCCENENSRCGLF